MPNTSAQELMSKIPAGWEVTSFEEGTVEANCPFTGATFSGSSEDFNAKFSVPFNFLDIVDVTSATEIAEGTVELATQAEVTAGSDAVRVVTPATFKGKLDLNGETTTTYATTMATNSAIATSFVITVTDGVAFAISNPTNATTGRDLVYRIRNTSGGAVGTITWGNLFKMVAWVSPATGYSRSIAFKYNGTNWIETFRSAGDIPN